MSLNIRKIACLLSVILLCFSSLTGCFPDLGNISDSADYESKFPTVGLIRKNLSIENLSVTDLYNDNAVNHFNDSDFVPPTESNAYRYMGVFAGEDVNVKEFALYLRSETDVTLEISVYCLSKLPTKIATGESDDWETYTNPDTGVEETRLKSFDEPTSDKAVAKLTLTLKANVWNSFTVTSWNIGGTRSDTVTVPENHCLLFKFENNCVGYDKDGKKQDATPAVFCMTAMLIYVK